MKRQLNDTWTLTWDLVVHLQVHGGDVGPDGLRELPAGLPVCHGAQEQAATNQMAAPLLHIH